MNIEGLEKVRAAIKAAKPGRFGMQRYSFSPLAYWRHRGDSDRSIDSLRHECGTAGCIGGYAVAVLGLERDGELAKPAVISNRAEELLGLTREQAGALFAPTHKLHTDITKRQALAALDYAIKNRAIKWPGSKEITR